MSLSVLNRIRLKCDNGLVFNQARRGTTEAFLAEHGRRGITGRIRYPQTQGKNERNHQTMTGSSTPMPRKAVANSSRS